MEEKKQGGKRANSGRKPIDNPKELVSLYVSKESILTFGDKEKMRSKLYLFIASFKDETKEDPVPIKEKYTVETKIQILPMSDRLLSYERLIENAESSKEVENIIVNSKLQNFGYTNNLNLTILAKNKCLELGL